MAGFSFADEHEAEVFYSKVHGRARLRPCEFPLTPTLLLDVHSSRLSVVAHISHSITLTYHLSSFFSCCHWVYSLSFLFSYSSFRYLFFSFPPYFSPPPKQQTTTNKQNKYCLQSSRYLPRGRSPNPQRQLARRDATSSHSTMANWTSRESGCPRTFAMSDILVGILTLALR